MNIIHLMDDGASFYTGPNFCMRAALTGDARGRFSGSPLLA
jgi:hypothetical protein